MSQNAIACLPALPATSALRVGIRVVVIEQDSIVRAKLAAVFAGASAFVMAASVDSLFQGMRSVDEYVPEVVLCSAQHMTHPSLREYDGLLLETRSHHGDLSLRDPGGQYFSLRPGHVGRNLAKIETEVLSRKRAWLRYLLSSAASTDRQETGERPGRSAALVSWPIEDVAWVQAQRNYVVLHGGSGTSKRRGNLSMIESEMPAGNFLRISRSCAVNRAHIYSVIRKQNHLAITMTCGAVLRPSRSYMRLVLQAVPELLEPAAPVARGPAHPLA